MHLQERLSDKKSEILVELIKRRASNISPLFDIDKVKFKIQKTDENVESGSKLSDSFIHTGQGVKVVFYTGIWDKEEIMSISFYIDEEDVRKNTCRIHYHIPDIRARTEKAIYALLDEAASFIGGRFTII